MRGEGFGAMIITHYQRLLNYITPDVVHVMMEGRVALSGGPELAATWNVKAMLNSQKNSVTTIKKNYNLMTSDQMLS